LVRKRATILVAKLSTSIVIKTQNTLAGDVASPEFVELTSYFSTETVVQVGLSLDPELRAAAGSPDFEPGLVVACDVVPAYQTSILFSILALLFKNFLGAFHACR
jgi:hypothetical protein